MAGITLADAETKLALWMAAEEKVASGQSYSIGGRSLTRANLREIREQIEFWDGKIQKIAASGGRSGMRVRGVTPTG